MASSHATAPPSLPPSVEEAYRRKCVDLRRRQQEVEDQNDVARQRKARLVRGVRKMRLERAILLETLARRMRKGNDSGPIGLYDEDTEDSSDSPPTPQERPMRSKKAFRRNAGSPDPSGAAPTDPPTILPPLTGPAVPGSTSALNDRSSPPPPMSSTVPSAEPRPPPPKELYAKWFVDQLPDDEPQENKESVWTLAINEKWPTMTQEQKGAWEQKYEELMGEWTRGEDRRKRALNAERRAARVGRWAGENGADEGVEGSEPAPGS